MLSCIRHSSTYIPLQTAALLLLWAQMRLNASLLAKVLSKRKRQQNVCLNSRRKSKYTAVKAVRVRIIRTRSPGPPTWIRHTSLPLGAAERKHASSMRKSESLMFWNTSRTAEKQKLLFRRTKFPLNLSPKSPASPGTISSR